MILLFSENIGQDKSATMNLIVVLSMVFVMTQILGNALAGKTLLQHM